ncbi:hypothetical protein [Sporomusa malonica]|uniref:Uncharacterized protein n=1 Tax=Sporomusa malonica TaxID=112901 RepID=A0A1W2ATM1_9FIRM|nr:hypothetical protein [Sporomusa malonica]SMC63801.1 hypothetical protein SAMN04488500_10691 [Sporomusa malonica]
MIDLSRFEIIEALGKTDTVQSGSKVKYTGASDEQVRWGGNDDPRGLLTEGETYEIELIEPHTWHTKYYLKEFPGKKFNSVSFMPKEDGNNE